MYRTSAALLCLALFLGACAPLPSVDGRAGAASDLAAHGRDPGDPQALEALLAGLAGQPLSSDTAIRIALLNNPELQASYARLGFAAADVYEAARPRNPSLSVSVLLPDEGNASNQVGVGISQHVTELLMLGARTRLAEGEYERVRQLIGASALEVAADTEAAYLRVASAAQMVSVREAVARAANTSAGLAQRVFEAGNASRLELTLEKAAAADAALALMQARAEVSAARAALNRLLGPGAGDDAWRVTTTLAQLPAADDAVEDLLTLADRSRLDLAAARADVRLRADALGLTRRFRLLGEVDAGVSTERETDGSRITGPSIGLQLPLFDRGAGRIARAQAQLQQSEAALRALEVDITASVRARAAELASAREREEQYRSVLLPLREEIVGLMQRQVNFMLDDPARLLLARQQQYEDYGAYLQTVRDYWLARVELARAVGTALPGVVQAAPTAADAPSSPADASHQGMNHEGMNHEGMNHGSMHHQDMDHNATGSGEPR